MDTNSDFIYADCLGAFIFIFHIFAVRLTDEVYNYNDYDI